MYLYMYICIHICINTYIYILRYNSQQGVHAISFFPFSTISLIIFIFKSINISNFKLINK